ncbi:MAG: VTT domain-containing protein [Pseudomonadota bacterium]
MTKLWQFFQSMDKTAVRAIAVTLVLMTIILGLLVAGRNGGFIDFEALERALVTLKSSPLSFLIVAAIFCLGAFLGAPQFGLFAAVIAAFGPAQGALYAWAATMVSLALTFWTGRLAGEATVHRFAGPRVNALSDFIGRNAFSASAIVRLIPTAPFIVVNMVFGVSRARFLAYWGGSALGIIPKIALVAFAGQAVFAVLDRRPWLAGAALAALAMAWLALVFAVRRLTSVKEN